MFRNGSFNSGSINPGSIRFIGVVAQVLEQATGGFWFDFDSIKLRARQRHAKQEEKKKQAESIKDQLTKELAIAEREIEQEELRRQELQEIKSLVQNYRSLIESMENERLMKAMLLAIEMNTYSRLEQLERELIRQQEEDFAVTTYLLLL